MVFSLSILSSRCLSNLCIVAISNAFRMRISFFGCSLSQYRWKARSMLRYTWAVPNRPSSSSSCMTESVKVVKSFIICWLYNIYSLCVRHCCTRYNILHFIGICLLADDVPASQRICILSLQVRICQAYRYIGSFLAEPFLWVHAETSGMLFMPKVV